LNLNQTLYFDRAYHRFDFSFLRFFTNPSRLYGDYYLLSANNTMSSSYLSSRQPVHTIDTIVRLENSIPYIDQIFNSTILNLVHIERVKFYQRPCKEYPNLVGFHDEVYMCLCNRHRLPECFVLIHDIDRCSSMNNYCQNKGLCLQDNEFRNPLGFICVCDQCFFGDLCQFTTSQYSVSLDALIGQLIALHTPIYRQPTSVQLYLILAILFVIIGLSLNSITITLFSVCTKLRAVESSLYIMASSIFGICSASMLCIKFISIIFLPRMGTSQLGCASMEYLLKLFPTICDWLNAFVSLERLWFTRTGAVPKKTPRKPAVKGRFLR